MRSKNKKYKHMMTNLNTIEPHTKQALLSEYFVMCKNAFKIRSAISMCWDHGADSYNKIKALT
jgi:hypothetical protein